MPTAAEALSILGSGEEVLPAAYAPSPTSSGIQQKLDILSGKITADEIPQPQAATPKLEDRGAMDAFTGSATDMMTFGLSKPFNAAIMAGITDPIAGAITGDEEKYGGSFGDRYDRNMQRQMMESQAAGEAHPIASGAGDVAGLVGSMGAAAPKALEAGAEKVIPSVIDAMKQNAKVGAAIGGANALGYSEGDADERISAGVKGAVTGATLGAIVPPALMTKTGRAIAIPAAGAAAGYMLGGDTSSAGAGLALGIATLKSPEAIRALYGYLTQNADERLQAAALKKVQQNFGRDNLTIDEAKNLLASMGDKATIADIGGENTLGLARSTAGVPGEAKEAITKFLNTRQTGQSKRIEESLKKGMGSYSNFYDVEENLIASQAERASPLYAEAFKRNKVVDAPIINRIMKTPAAKEALAIAQKTMSDKMKLMSAIDPELTKQARLTGSVTKGGVGKGFKLETLDQVKKSLDTMYKTMSQSDNAAIRSRAGGVKDLKNSLLKALDEADVTATRDASGKITSPGLYKQARSVWADDESMKEALAAGRKFVAEDADLTVRQLKGMTDGEKEMFRVGASRALQDKIRTTAYGSDAVKNIFGSPEQLFGSPAKRDRLMAVFPTKEAFLQFEKEMMAEAKMYATRAHVLPRQGSKTQPALAEEADLGISPALENAAKGNWYNAGKEVFMSFLDRYKMSPEVRNLIGQKLFTDDPVANAQTLKLLQELEQAEQQKALGQGLQMPAIAGQTGRGAGLLMSQ